ncbi:hypothetical protein HanXRQr2_Chr09g0366061 [Helianthus annuus]|uniref:Uncharacterized protein n=1 Tax=Helianthus annuus TaxID=4232 RepID=A0A9K3I2E2_HELAN|nr:hypothetical protein HanXRQr2_Chr09g0366061 [Helianthus annuus]KAJ0464645.1 hypothetical protein HanHA300_Chr14g0529661 [Helianthus annuus]KAJ0486242.1 hypothetical protein HanHA89_Chr14g0577531 [Helianthus annuus]KAJ0656794.1 hypothetical protein HanLR1_Chr14g0539951 [Helianthus annuus]KAJ0660390.1 hypothetical protein HanOQP8_Chr14g0537271 [Helianthus annuus]
MTRISFKTKLINRIIQNLIFSTPQTIFSTVVSHVTNTQNPNFSFHHTHRRSSSSYTSTAMLHK